ncbi:MAG: hypothetical protein DHS20C16_03580 [Phycisphaerae bacterium]|nr:MAG: hypothetical protein DHS20C16_03580 [Phycisphaerae bacterium]
MARTVAAAGFGLTAKTKPFERGMKRAAKATGGVTRALGFLKSKAFGFGAALTAAVGVGGLGIMVKQSFETIDALGKTSDKLGTTTEGLAGLRLAAELTGQSGKQLDVGLQRMTRRLSEVAATGKGVAKPALLELGLDAERLGKMTPTEQFAELAGAFGKVKSQSDKVRLGFALFDSDGVGLINTLALGKEGLAGVAEQAGIAGIALNRVEVAKIEQANDAVTILQKHFIGLANTIAINLAPFVTHLATRFTEATIAGGGMGQIVTKSIGWIVKATSFALEAVDALRFGFGLFKIGVVGVAAATVDGFNGLLNFIADIPHFLDVAATTGAEFFLRAIDWMGRGIVDLINLIPGVEIAFSDAAVNMANDLAKELADKVRPEHIDFTGGLADGLDLVVNEMVTDLNDGLAKGAFDTAMRFEKWFDGVNDAATKAAEQTIAKAQEVGTPTLALDKQKKAKAAKKDKGVAALQAGSAAALKAIAKRGGNQQHRRDIQQQQQTELLTVIWKFMNAFGGDALQKLGVIAENSPVATNVT